jgi:hypothetical protein
MNEIPDTMRPCCTSPEMQPTGVGRTSYPGLQVRWRRWRYHHHGTVPKLWWWLLAKIKILAGSNREAKLTPDPSRRRRLCLFRKIPLHKGSYRPADRRPDPAVIVACRRGRDHPCNRQEPGRLGAASRARAQSYFPLLLSVGRSQFPSSFCSKI